MNKMEITRMLQDTSQKIKWYFVCCRRIQNDNYKLALYSILQKIQSNLRWLSNENVYPKTDNYNKMKIHYEMYLLQFEKTKLKQIAKTERLSSRNMQNVTYNEINMLLVDVNIIKNEIFNNDINFRGFSKSSILAMNLESYAYLLELSYNFMPSLVTDRLKSICNHFNTMLNYIQDDDELIDTEEIDKILIEILKQFDELEDYKDKIRTLKALPMSIVELAYNVYGQVYIILKEFKDNKKTNLTVYDCEIV